MEQQQKASMAKKREQTATVDIKIRMRERLRAKIERAAGVSAISMNLEMVNRLEKSFEDERRAVSTSGGSAALAIAKLIGVVIDLRSGGGTNTHWLQDRNSFDQTVRAINAVLEQFKPAAPESITQNAQRRPSESETDSSWSDAFAAAAATEGTYLARMTVADLKGAPGGLPAHKGKQKALLAQIGRDLGPLVQRLDVDQLQTDLDVESEAAQRDARGTREGRPSIDKKGKGK
jgi:hypothetical protein